ncbi:MAG: GNAT family N-acetyltransferase [Anaerolineae bacterium]
MNSSEGLRIRPLDIAADAEKLVEMWRASDDQWPGTFTRGISLSADWVQEWHRREEMLEVRVAEVDGRIVGYASLNPVRREEGVAYVHVINVRPDYQGRSIGRRLLTTFVERCAELGFHRVDLHTWSGNLKAVPLYKKTGFFWMPETSVWMLNFIPGILRFPLARPFFQDHDWYETLQRELNQQEDDEGWNGMRVFTYRWRAGGTYLRARRPRGAGDHGSGEERPLTGRHRRRR